MSHRLKQFPPNETTRSLRDLVEVAPDPRVSEIAKHHHTDLDTVAHCQYLVDFLHLTVKDFILTSKVKQQLMSWIDASFDPYFLICESFLFLLKVLPDSIFEGYSTVHGYLRADERIEDYHCSGLDQIGGYLEHIEIKSRDISSALIDELHRLLIARVQGLEIRLSYPPIGSELAAGVVRLSDDFLPWAVMMGLVGYVASKIEQNPAYVTESNKGMLLHYAAINRHESLHGNYDQRGNACLDIMRTTLLHGVAPNYTDLGGKITRIWSDYLSMLLGLSLDHLDPERDICDRQNRFFGSDNLLARTDMLLEYGADPAKVVSGGLMGRSGGDYHYEMNAVQVFGQIFRSEQVAVLMQRIDKTIDTSQGYTSPDFKTYNDSLCSESDEGSYGPGSKKTTIELHKN